MGFEEIIRDYEELATWISLLPGAARVSGALDGVCGRSGGAGAAEYRRGGRVPARARGRRGPLGTLGVTFPRSSAGRGATTSRTRSRSRRSPRQRGRRGDPRGQQLARRGALDEFGTETQNRLWLPAARHAARRSGPSRCRRIRPGRMPRTRRRSRGSTNRGTASTGARSGSPTPKWPICSIVFAATQSRHTRTGHLARSSCRWTPQASWADARRLARRPRSGVRGPRVRRCPRGWERAPGRDRPGGGFRIAMRALEGGRVAIAAQALGVGQAALDEALAYARASGRRSGSRSAISRRCS